MENLYQKTLYLNKDLSYLFNCEIIEYDMKRAGLSLIQSKLFKLRDYVGEKKIKELEFMGKEECNKEIGVMQKNKEFAKLLLETFAEARKMFFEANDIPNNNILAIKKDAIFIINKRCEHCIFDTINFRIKNVYYGYMYLNKCEFYYKDSMSPIDVKGIDDEILQAHQDYMLDFIRDVFTLANNQDIESIQSHLLKFISAYRSLNLDKEYYRNLNSTSLFTYIDPESGPMEVKGIDEDDIDKLDISYNYFNYIIPIISIFV